LVDWLIIFLSYVRLVETGRVLVCIRRCRSILRRGSRFNASDQSYQPSSARAAAGQLTTDIDDDHIPPPLRARSRSTDVASRVALLASIPLVSGGGADNSRSRGSHRQHKTSRTQLEVSSTGAEVIDAGGQSTAAAAAEVTQHDSGLQASVDVDDEQRCRPDNDLLPQSPHTEESRQVNQWRI